MQQVNLTQIGNSMGIILNKEALAKLGVSKKGDSLYLNETADGFKLSAFNEEYISQMEIAADIIREDREVLKALAKK